MEQQQAFVEVCLHPQRVAVGQVLAAEVDLQPFDGALDPGPSSVARSLAGEVLRVIPIDAGKIRPVDPDVPPSPSQLAGLGQGAAVAHALAVRRTIGRRPDVALLGDVAPPHLEATPGRA